MRTFLVMILAVLILAMPGRLLACMWDYDTIAMERERFPEAHELIAGMFVRHSSAYYEWRIQDREQTPLAERTPADYDDIAVAYDKLGRHAEAIETMRAKMERWPNDGRYESHANLGTFHIHAGEYEAGLVHIEKAIEINPEAHFGREIYQKLLVEYVLAVREAEGEGTLPLRNEDVYGMEDWRISGEEAGARPSHAESFAMFVLHMQATGSADREAELSRAVTGVLGMMRFGSHDSPILLEAMGDLLLASGDDNDAKMLASRAYLKASYETDDVDASAAYRDLAEQALSSQREMDLGQVESQLQKEIARGDAYFAQIESDERAWAAAGKDLDAKFAEEYYEAPSLGAAQVSVGPVDLSRQLLVDVVVGIAIVLVVVAAVAVVFIMRHRRKPSIIATP